MTEHFTSSPRLAIYNALRKHRSHPVPVSNEIKFAGAGSGIFPATPAKRAALNRAHLFRQALDSPAIRREIDAKVKRFVHERLSEALRRSGNGNITIRL